MSDGEVEIRWRNFYRCPRCGHEWEDCWDCQCDDDGAPSAGLPWRISPTSVTTSAEVRLRHSSLTSQRRDNA